MQIQDWHVWGLPDDDVCVANAAMVLHAGTWPLLLDPQGQALPWLRGMGASGLQVIPRMCTCIGAAVSHCLRLQSLLLPQGFAVSFWPMPCCLWACMPKWSCTGHQLLLLLHQP